MFRFPWMSNLLNMAQPRKDRRCQAPRRHRSVRLTLEAMEDRVVPSVVNPTEQLLVNSLAVGSANGTASQAPMANAFLAPLAAGNHNVTVTAQDASVIYYRNTFTLKATIQDTTAPTNVVDFGQVTFTILDETTKKPVAGSYVAPVNKGAAQVTPILALPLSLEADTYIIQVHLTDNRVVVPHYVDTKDISATLTVLPRTTAATIPGIPKTGVTLDFSPKAQNVPITVNITDTTNGVLPISVFEGKAYFYLYDSKNNDILNGPGYIVAVKNGAAKSTLIVPANQAPGKYTITVLYQDGTGNFKNTKVSAPLTIAAPAVPKANKVGAVSCPNAQTVALSATVTDPDDPSDTVNEGVVTFTVAGIGTVQGAVVNGLASADITLPGGEAAGDYAIAVSYSDSSGDFFDDGDTGSTLTITSCAATSAASASQMAQQLGTYLGNLQAQFFQDAQSVLNSFAAVLQGQQPLSALVQSWIQFNQLSSVLQELAQGSASPSGNFPEPSPAGGEQAASANPQLIGD